MKRFMLIFVLWTIPSAAQLQEPPGGRQYLDLRVDNLVINTHGLTEASRNLSVAIDRLSQAFEKISENDQTFTAEEKQVLLNSARAVERASVAVEDLSRRLPQMSADFSARLPQLVEQSRAPIAEISAGLHSASASVTNIVEHLPQATENTKQLVDSAMNSALIRLTVFVVIVLALLALVLILVFRYLFKTYLEPVAELMAPLKDAPLHFANLSRHMENTSANMLRLERTRRGRWFKPPR